MVHYTCCVESGLTEYEIEVAAAMFHYRTEDMPLLKEVYRSMCPVRARAYIAIYKNKMECALTLGQEVDDLQERYYGENRLTESYMVECLSLECMKHAYPAVAAWLQEKTGLWAGRMRFPGADEPLKTITEILERLDQDEITINEACMLRPGKSVVYTADLLGDRPSSGVCSVCSSCGNAACGYQDGRKSFSGQETDPAVKQ